MGGELGMRGKGMLSLPGFGEPEKESFTREGSNFKNGDRGGVPLLSLSH